jgi:putative endonuclease
MVGGFTQRYNIARLVCYEAGLDVRAAIAREKEIKGWSRAKKIVPIRSVNRRWRDLSAHWFGD